VTFSRILTPLAWPAEGAERKRDTLVSVAGYLALGVTKIRSGKSFQPGMPSCRPRFLELSHDRDYDQRAMADGELKPTTFFAGLHLLARIICGIGACLFLASFFVQDLGGLGRALGLFGIGLVLCGVAVNLLMEISARKAEPRLTRHLLVQSLLASFVAVAVFCLAVYVFRHGALPKFMPTRYD
jgi:hypothetical protein